MKTLILLTTLLLLNCADNITSQTYEMQEKKAWCTTEKYNNGEPHEMYVVGVDTMHAHEYTDYYTVVVDSVKGDSIFINTTDGEKVIIERKYGTIDKILSLNKFYDMMIDFNGYAELYHSSKDIVRCTE